MEGGSPFAGLNLAVNDQGAAVIAQAQPPAAGPQPMS